MGAANTTYTLKAFSTSTINSLVVTIPSSADSIDVGSIRLCNNFSYETGFNITGNGYNGNSVGFITSDMNGAYWNSQNNSTFATIFGYTNMGTCTLAFSFQGQQITTIDFSTDSANMNFNLNELYYYPPNPTSDPFILEVTSYGPVGDSIKGTFHGALKLNWTGPEVIISNGKFAFPRTPDH